MRYFTLRINYFCQIPEKLAKNFESLTFGRINSYHNSKSTQICQINSTFLLYIPKNLLIILNKNKIYLNLNYKYKKR